MEKPAGETALKQLIELVKEDTPNSLSEDEFDDIWNENIAGEVNNENINETSKEKYNGEITLAKLIRNIGAWFNDKVSKSTTINGKALSGNINLTAEDVGAASSVVSTGTVTFESQFTDNGTLLTKVGNIVLFHLSFISNSTLGTGTLICTIPAGYRPSSTLKFKTFDGLQLLSTNGEVTVDSSDSAVRANTKYAMVFAYNAAN